MKLQSLIKNVAPALFGAVLLMVALGANAAVSNAGVLDNVLAQYQTQAATWGATITNKASFIFWTLVVISMVYTFGMMALRKADVGEFFAEFISFTIVTGFFWWALTNGSRFATDIMTSLRQLAATASGNPSTFTPSSIVDMGFDIFFKVLDQSSVWSPVDSMCGILMAAVILIVLTLVGVNMLLLLVAGWFVAYAGVFVLGFGGSKWTSDMAIGFYKTALSIALQLFSMVLLVGIGKTFIDGYYASMSAGLSLKEMSVMMVAAIVLLALVNKIPEIVGQLPFGGGAGTIGQHGAGSFLAAAGVAGAAGAYAASGISSAATSVAGGASALMAAYNQAQGNVAAGTDVFGGMSGGAGTSGGGEGGGAGSPLASAMGSAGASSAVAPADGGGSSSGGGASSGGGIRSQMAAMGKAAGQAAVKAGRVAADTGANLASGTWQVAKEKASERVEAAQERISETFGGQVAQAIKESGAGPELEGSLSAGTAPAEAGQQTAAASDSAAEVAAFVNRDQGAASV